MEPTSPEKPTNSSHRIVDLKAGAHVMLLDAGVYCIFQAPGQAVPNASGLPGARISRAPGVHPDIVQISSFEADGWLGITDGAALVKVNRGPAGVMITTYQEPGSPHAGPKLQVLQLIGGVTPRAPEPKNTLKAPTALRAHFQKHGDVGVRIGEWLGERGSGLWIEGFEIIPPAPLTADDLEYQAVLGKGWLSPWSSGGRFCGSRGMSLPILGLNVRLNGRAAQEWSLRLEATFIDGYASGVVEGGVEPLESPNLSPLEAFRIVLEPRG